MLINFDFRTIHPKCLEALKTWIYNHHEVFEDLDFNMSHSGDLAIESALEIIFFNPLELDFFFDSVGIMGHVFADKPNIVTTDTKAFWVGRIRLVDSSEWLGSGKAISWSRSQALIALWTKEFTLLEERLTNG